MSQSPLALLLFIFGLVVGPWLGILVDSGVRRARPAGLDHGCPGCGSSLGGWATLVPVAHWMRRCPRAGESGDPGGQESVTHSARRYVIVDLATAFGFGAVALRFGAGWELGPYLWLVAALVVMSVIDLETHLLLDVLTLRVLPISLVLVLLLHNTAEGGARTWPALAGALTFVAILGVLFIVYPPGLGFGDVKLAPTLGLFLGWMTDDVFIAVRLVIFALLGANLISGVGIVLWRWVRRRPIRGVETPMGPSLAAATLLIVVLSHPDVSGLLTR